MTDFIVTLALILVVIVIVVAILRLAVDVVTVHDYERGVRYRRGRFSGLVDAGTYPSIRPLSEIRVLDGRPAYLPIEGQEILTADGIALRLSLAARYVVVDPVTVVTGDQDFRRALYLTLQLALRDAVAGQSADQLLTARTAVGPTVLELAASRVAQFGVELLSVEVRDLMLPGELKRAFAGVVAARKEGEAALERARGETAALRNLANAAGMLEQHPGLLQVRLLQELGASSGNTIVVGMPEAAPPGAAAAVATGTSAGRRRAAERGTSPERDASEG